MSDEHLNYSWPIDFPKGIPESIGVIPAKGKVYRLVRTIPPQEIDFQRHRDEKENYLYSKKLIPYSYGVSFWSKLSKIKRVEENYPAPEQYAHWETVCGNLCPSLGVIPAESAKNGHITLWTQEGAEPHKHVKDKVQES